MRKLLLTTALALPLTFGAAFAQDATTAPADGTMTPDAMAPATDAPMTGEMDADGDNDGTAMEAEMANSDMVAQEQAANELRLDWVTGASVTSPDGTAIGSISDLIVDGENGTMIAAIVGVGGFLGIGEKQIALPWEQLMVNYDAQEITSNLTVEQADAAPEYVFRERADAPMADGTTPPADGMAPPPPADGMAPPPADGMAPPPPADGMAPPPADGMAPADGAMEPEDDAMAPAGDAPAPAN